MNQVFEAFMLICFGLSWPVSILKSVRSRTAKGKSLVFVLFVLVGYACGIVSKLVAGTLTYVIIFYALNFVMVAVDAGLYLRNRRLDRLAESAR